MRNDYNCRQGSFGVGEIVFQAGRVVEVASWVVHEAHQRLAVWVRTVQLLIDREFFGDLALSEAGARHLRFDDNLLPLEQQVNAAGQAGAARSLTGKCGLVTRGRRRSGSA
jgi:hypothetical protein